MDTQRLLLLIALSFVVLLMWQQWQVDYGPAPKPPMQQQPTAGTAPTAQPPITEGDIPESVPELATAGQTTTSAVPTLDTEVFRQAQSVRVQTDTFTAVIDTYGGDLRRVDLNQFPVSLDEPDVPFTLMNDVLPNLFVAQSGLIGTDVPAPNHHAVYTVENTDYALRDGQDTLQVPLTWTDPSGVSVVKTYTFTRGSYLIDVAHNVTNDTESPWKGRQYRQLQRTQVAEDNQSQFIYTYMGGALYTPAENYEKVDFADMTDQDLSLDSTNGWAAMMQHYFLGAWIPEPPELNHYYTKALPGARYLIGLVAPAKTLAPGETTTFASALYVGPKVQDVLAAIAPGLDLTVDYGILTVLSQPLFWLLKKIYEFVGNWGWSILLVTFLIKLAFFKLSETSYRSMANMRRMQPRMQALKERFGSDKQKLNQAMMELYKKEKINPLGGCLPIAIQIPVFIALYWVLLESVELRQAPFIFWIKDLSVRDPFYVLPLIMGVTMFLQQRLNPAPLDPIQQKVMMALPVVFTVFFAFFPAGLVLYWVANNILSIAQQWVITKRVEEAAQHKN